MRGEIFLEVVALADFKRGRIPGVPFFFFTLDPSGSSLPPPRKQFLFSHSLPQSPPLVFFLSLFSLVSFFSRQEKKGGGSPGAVAKKKTGRKKKTVHQLHSPMLFSSRLSILLDGHNGNHLSACRSPMRTTAAICGGGR